MIIDLCVSGPEYRARAAHILREAFRGRGAEAWPSMDAARAEVEECCAEGFLCLGLAEGEGEAERLAGWAGLRPMYEYCWELHPLAVLPERQGKGVGRALMEAIERAALSRGLRGIALGTDDENGETSLAGRDIAPALLFDEIKAIKNPGHHPYGFYQACGYAIVGVIPHANGFGKPDIWMWKGLTPGVS